MGFILRLRRLYQEQIVSFFNPYPQLISMFGSLRKKLKEGVAKLSRKMEEPAETPEKVPEEPREEKPKPARREIAAESARKPEAAPKPVRSDVSRQAGPKPPKKEPVIEEPKREVPKPEPRAEKREPEPVAEEQPKGTQKHPDTLRDTGGHKDTSTPKGRFARFRERVSTRELTAKDIDDFFEESEVTLLQSDVAVEVMDSLKEKLKEKLVQSKVSRGRDTEAVHNAFRESLLEIVDQGDVELLERAKRSKKEGKPLTMVFLGFNGAGKTTSIAKTASFLKKNNLTPVLAAADTFRAASIEQLEVHGEKLGVKIIKHNYGSDAAAVIFDACKYAEKNSIDVVLADTAGRTHTDKNLMDELKKVIRVNSPDLRVLVVDSLTGNDAVEQARKFNDAVGVDCVVMTKTDVNPRGGSILSVVHTIGKPILFLGTGQEYDKIEMFDPGKFVDQLLE